MTTQPISDHESDSSIDWDEPDMISDNESGGTWPSWARHKMRIAARIEKTRQQWGYLSEKDLNKQEQSALKGLRKWLDEWRDSCAICHFLNRVSLTSHKTESCKGALAEHVCSLSSKL